MKEQKFMVWLVPDAPLPKIIPAMYQVLAKDPHVTLEYGVTREEARNKEGRKFTYHFEYEASDEDIQALKVAFSGEPPYCKNKHPHITISMRQGIKPVQSNAMLEKPNAAIYFMKPVVYTGTVKFVPMG